MADHIMATKRQCCTDHKGQPKKKYATREDASDAARLMEIERDIITDIYECEARDGWHLTSHHVRQEPRILRKDIHERRKRKLVKTTLGRALGQEFFDQLKVALNRNNSSDDFT